MLARHVKQCTTLVWVKSLLTRVVKFNNMKIWHLHKSRLWIFSHETHSFVQIQAPHEMDYANGMLLLDQMSHEEPKHHRSGNGTVRKLEI